MGSAKTYSPIGNRLLYLYFLLAGTLFFIVSAAPVGPLVTNGTSSLDQIDSIPNLLSLAKRNIINNDQYLTRVRATLGDQTEADRVVPVGSYEYQDFKDFSMCSTTPARKTIVSQGFASCFGIVVVSSKGALVGHYIATPFAGSSAKDNYAVRKYIERYKEHEPDLKGARAFVFVPSKDYAASIMNLKQFVREEITGSNPVPVEYVVRTLGHGAVSDKDLRETSILVASSGGTPEVYMGGVLVS